MNITLNNEMKMFYYALLNRSAMYLQQCYCLKCSTNFQTKHSNLKNRFFFQYTLNTYPGVAPNQDNTPQ